MKRADLSLDIGIIASLVVHTGLALLMINVYIQEADEWARNGYAYRWARGPTADGLIVLSPGVEPIVRLPEEPARPEAVPPLPALPPVVRRPAEDPLDRFLLPRFGEDEAKGTAIKSSPGDEPMAGREGKQDQPWLSQDPVGPALNPPEPSPYTGLPGDNGNGGRMTIPGPGGAGPAARPGGAPSLVPPATLVEKPEPPNTPFGAPAPALPPQPKLVARPPIRDIVAEAPEKPDNIIGEVRPVPKAEPSVVEGHSPKPNQLLVDAQSTMPTTLPAIVVRKKPNDLNPEVAVDDPTKVTPADMPRELAVLDNLLRPTTRKVDPLANKLIPDAIEDGVGSVAVKGPTTRPADAVAMRDPNDRPDNATVDKTKDAKPTTLPVGENPLVKSDYNPDLKRHDKPGEPNQPKPMLVASSAEAGSAGVANPGPGGDPLAGNGRPGLPMIPADPAPQTDSESDPFTSVGTVKIRPGKIEAQLGRKVKPIRPQLTLKGEMDLISMGHTRVALRVTLDRKGKVTDVKVSESSGSDDIDLSVVVAVYKWWIEPPTDKRGNPRGDVMMLTCGFE
ncbi:MAG: energy transducer TonB [Tepidisphaerales bacterium]